MRTSCHNRQFCLLLTMIVLAGVVAVVSGCGQHQATTTTRLVASWARLYHSVGDLKKASDVVVAGTITSIADTTRQGTTPFTDFTFTIARVVYDPQHRVTGSTVVIHQTGGVINGARTEVADDPLFGVGESAELFLHEYSTGQYFVVGGPSGRFRIEGGVVHSVNDEGVRFATPPSASTFEAQVQQA